MPIRWSVLLAAPMILWTAGAHLLGLYTDRFRYAALVDRPVEVAPSSHGGTAVATPRTSGHHP